VPLGKSLSCSLLQRTHQVVQIFHILAKITGEPPGIPPLAHAGAHILNTPPLERRYARAHLGDPTSREAVELRKQIATGARAALEEQYLDYWSAQFRPAHLKRASVETQAFQTAYAPFCWYGTIEGEDGRTASRLAQIRAFRDLC